MNKNSMNWGQYNTRHVIKHVTLKQYKNFNSGQFQNRNKPHENRFLHNNNTQQNSTYTEIICNYFKKPGHLVRDCKIRPNNQSQTAHQENSKALTNTGALRKA